MIDDKGKVKIFKWKINIFDLGVIILIATALAISGWVYYRYSTYKLRLSKEKASYVIFRKCPNCEKENKIFIGVGVSIEEFLEGHNGIYKQKCHYCKNEGVFLEGSSTHYFIHGTCPSCGELVSAKIKLGQPRPKNYTLLCPFCKNQIVLSEPAVDYQNEYYKYLLDKEKP